ncbi:MAG: CotH kinase family protein [Salinivirgaceae bacterium]|jgi:hypothetical protein|nr:CotH kinase family protein [Salinivirgaceae bacterium]
MKDILSIPLTITSYRLNIRLFILVVFFASVQVISLAQSKENVILESSNLPIVVINTSGVTIPENERVVATMGIVNNGTNAINYISDEFNEYNGRIEIRLRGHSSTQFPKRSFRIETQDSAGNNNNVPLLGMSKENDWILYAPYSDKSLMRNALSYKLAGKINDYAPRTEFCELILNETYMGVYILTEKIKQDKNRVNIAKMTSEDILEPEVTGGYIFKYDWYDTGDNGIILNSGLNLIVVEPQTEEILPEQEDWLVDYLNSFESALYNNNGDYNDFIDVESFIDNFLIVEFLKNIDGFRLSTFFYKDRNGKIVAGPIWDYNLSLGNADYNYGWSTERWYHEDEWSPFYWFEELIFSKEEFSDQIKARWATLRKDIFEYNQINSIIDEWAILLEEAQERNFTQWEILDKYIWPNPGFPESGEMWGTESPKTGAATTWQGEIDYIKNFIEGRLEWMDFQLGYHNAIMNVVNNVNTIQAYPNPSFSTTTIKYTINQPGKVLLKMFTLDGREIKILQDEFQSEGEYQLSLSVQGFKSGVYFIKLQINNHMETLKLIIQK